MAQEVQLLMDCVADMVVHEGVQNMGQMTQAGMTLFPESRPRFVRGQFPDHMGGGKTSLYYSLTIDSTPGNQLLLAEADLRLVGRREIRERFIITACRPVRPYKS